MAYQFKVATAKGPYAFESRYNIGDPRLARSFQTVFGVAPSSFTPTSFRLVGGKPIFGATTGRTSAMGATAPAAAPSPLDAILKTLASVNKQIKQIQQQSVTATQQVPTTMEELGRYREQVGIPGFEEQRAPLQETAKGLVERMKGLPEELKTRFQEFLIPEQFRSRKEDVEREQLTGQLQTVTDQQSIIEDAIKEGERRVQEAAGLARGQRQAALNAVNTALKYLYDSRTQLQKQQSAIEKQIADAKKAAAKAASAAAGGAGAWQSTLLSYVNTSAFNRLSKSAKSSAIMSKARALASQYPKSATSILSFANSLVNNLDIGLTDTEKMLEELETISRVDTGPPPQSKLSLGQRVGDFFRGLFK